MNTKGFNHISILGINVTTNSKKGILEYVEKYLENPSKKALIIVTPNPEQIVLAQTDSLFKKILNRADIAIPDGIGLAWAAGCKKIAGVDLMEDLVSVAAKRGLPIALIGGRGGVALKAFECLFQCTPGLTGWAGEPGDFTLGQLDKLDKFVNPVAEKIRQTGTRLVFVGLGAPNQEYFINFLASHVSRITYRCVFMSVGGAFDIIAGKTPRAPLALRALGLEWLWRLILEPWRWRRQLALIQFLWLVFKEKFFHTKRTI
ncbi:WecB/TagA/CpsF family glycosyltransferase [Candidatus Gottesmanbacteria bacterium]|nr:WecB/TagA/CpsF family glycosyltransferase [Candidatus Gottesmanbacteria bacterium]